MGVDGLFDNVNFLVGCRNDVTVLGIVDAQAFDRFLQTEIAFANELENLGNDFGRVFVVLKLSTGGDDRSLKFGKTLRGISSDKSYVTALRLRLM